MRARVTLELETGCSRSKRGSCFRDSHGTEEFNDPPLNVKEEQKYFQILWLVRWQGPRM